ncbi:MAG TPA: GNAT family N-acetyltransferase [Puia sp.]|nr:GNAT family N-acetyltransferase [Puia sp.]
MIRKARVSDWPQIRLLLDQLEYKGTEGFLEARIERLVNDPDEALLVYEEDLAGGLVTGRLVTVGLVTGGKEAGSQESGAAGRQETGGKEAKILGFISLHFIPQIALEGDFARISYFAVHERARGGGIGQALEEHCMELARERGCSLIEVHCHTRRERAHAFYFRQGYEESPKYLIKRLK